jgi:cytochrome b pre-mRNA-processing protein 3
MFAKLFKRSRASIVPQELYGSVVAQARQAAFFTNYGFEDTVTGRYDVVALHLFLFSRRLVREDTTLAQNLNQEVFDLFTDETDRALRELGVGDTSVPKRKKRLVHSFYAIVEELAAPLDTGDKASLARLIEARFSSKEGKFNSVALSEYVIEAAKSLDKVKSEDLFKGLLDWPSPDAFI